MPLLDPNQSYTFSKYFELGFEASELAVEFGYTLVRRSINLPQFSDELDRLTELRDRIEEILPYVPLTSEQARREIFISRIVTEVIHLLIGAISTGTIWQFATLDRGSKHFQQGINSYRVPEDLEPLLRILVAALT